MNAPKRIQRKRTRGWRMPENAVYVGRPTRWGNQWNFNPKSATSRRVAVGHYRHYAEAMHRAGTDYTRGWFADLRGRDLACCRRAPRAGERMKPHVLPLTVHEDRERLRFLLALLGELAGFLLVLGALLALLLVASFGLEPRR